MKSEKTTARAELIGRPRKGAWIEIRRLGEVVERYESPPQGGVD